MSNKRKHDLDSQRRYRTANGEAYKAYMVVYNKAYRLANKEKLIAKAKRYRLENKEKIATTKRAKYLRQHATNLKKARLNYQRTKSARLKQDRERYKTDPIFRAKRLAVGKRWRLNNREKVRANARDRERKSRATPKGNLDARMSRGIHRSLKGGKQGRSWQQLVGYTADELKVAVEKAFRDGMNWGALLAGKIHIDHVIPQSKFNYTSADDMEFKRCWALENLRPMWAKDNLVKSNKIQGPSQIPLGV